MKFQKVLLVFTILFVCLQSSIGQEEPKPRQINEFGKINCEDLGARLSALRPELRDDENSKGYIIIYGDKANPLGNYKFEELIKNRFNFLGIDVNRVVFIHGKSGESINIQVWIVPSGAAEPPYIEEKWNYSLPENIKPFKLYEKAWEGEECPSIENARFYSKLLLGNPSFGGNIVIYENSFKKFTKTKSRLIEELVNKYKVPLNRLKFYYVKSSGDSNFEFWLVP